METLNNIKHTIDSIMIAFYIRMMAFARGERGQGALEYIGMVIGLALMVALGFKIAGRNIFDEASTFVSRIVEQASMDQ